jgi:hypothetical protein
VTSALRVNSLMPPFVPLGTASITVVLGTTGYQQGTTNVYFNGLVQTANFNSTTNQLSITLSGSQLATAGAYPIYLSNGPGTQSNAMYFSVGSPSSSNGGLAVLAEQVSGQTVDVAYVPLPPLPTDPAGSGGYVAIVQLDTLDPMPFLPINGFISNTSAFVLPGDSSHTPTFLYDGGIGYNAVLKTLAMPAGFVPTMTAADPGDNLVLVASSTSGKVQLINSPAHTLAAVYTITTAGSLTFSGGDQCTGLCNLVVDHSGQAGRAIAVASTPTGYLSFTPTTGAIVQTYVSSPIGEVFAYDSTPTNWGAITPYYLSNGMSGAQYVDLHNAGAAVPINNLVGFRPDSAAVDNWTQLAVMPDEGSGVNYVVNFFGLPSTLPASLSLPGTSFTIPGGTYCDLRPDWTLTSIEPNTHILLSGQEFSNCIAATQLPPAPIADANGNPVSPAAPTQIRFGRVSAPQPDPGQDPKGYLLTPPWGNFSFTGLDPDGHAWQNSGDPHLFTTFTSVLTGKPTTLVVEDTSGLNGIWMAELPMNDFVNFTTGLVGAVSSLGEVSPKDMGTLATYIRVANPAPVITNLEPVQVPHRAFSASVAVLGAGFVSDGFFPASYIVFNNELKPYPFTQWASENEIFFDLTQADLSLPIATYPVYVQNPPPLDANGARGTAPAGMTSATFNLQIVYAQPTIASISPGQVLHATAVTITVVGTGYESTGPSGGTQVFFNGGPKTPTVSSDGTYLTFTLTATDAPLAGNYTIELVNPAPGGGSISGVLVVQ